MGSLSLLQRIFPTQGSNPGLPHCRQILYQLSHKGSPRILEWAAYPFSRGNPGIKPGSPALQTDSLPTGLSGTPQNKSTDCQEVREWNIKKKKSLTAKHFTHLLKIYINSLKIYKRMKTLILDFFLQMVKKGRVKKILSKNGEK